MEKNNGSHIYTFVRMDGDKFDSSSGSISNQQFQCMEIESGNMDDITEHTLKGENISESEELVIDGEMEEFHTEGNIEEIKYVDADSCGEWHDGTSNGDSQNEVLTVEEGYVESSNVESSNVESSNVESSNVEYYEIATTDDKYGVSDEEASSKMKCYEMSSVVEGGNECEIIREEDVNTSNVEYYEVSHIHDNANNLVAEEAQIQSENSEFYQEPTIIVHLGNNLTIDETGQIHPSTSEYEDGTIDPSETVFYSEATDEICCDTIDEESHNEEGKKFV